MAMDKLYKGQSIDADGNLVGEPTLDSNGQKIADIRNVQMNEKLSNSVYQIVHPETNAYQVITNSERRFVSDKEKEIWNNAWQLAAEALHYQGVWNRNGKYHMFDVVYYDSNVTEGGELHTYRGFFIWYDDRVAADWINAQNAAERKEIYDRYDSSTHSLGGTTPPQIGNDAESGWISINFSAYLAHFASGVEVLTADSGEYYLTFAKNTNLNNAPGNYKKLNLDTHISFKPATNTLTIQDPAGNNTIILNGSTGTITAKKFVGDMQGNAEAAEKYVTYIRDSEGNLILDIDGNRQISSSEYIEDELLDIIDRINKITSGDGGVVLNKKLQIQKNGENLNGEGFNGSEDQIVNITFSPEEITGLLNKNNNKIANKWLPDSILGSMSFCGTFNPETGSIVVDLRPFIQDTDENGNAKYDGDGNPIYTTTRRGFQIGDYLIAVGKGNIDPDGKVRHDETITPDSAETTYFITGDWAVYSDITDDQQAEPTVWIKIDNTDAVRTVNSQIGDVKTYKGDWNDTTQYYGGDIVYYEGSLYLASENTIGGKTLEDGSVVINDKFIIFGRVYSASDGIELDKEDNWTFKHTWKGAADGNDSLAPKPLTTINASEVEMNDRYGHIKSTVKHTITLPDDTWRGVKIYDYKTGDYQEGLKKRSYNDAVQQDLLLKGDQMVNADWLVDNAETGEGHVNFSHTTNGALGAGSQTDGIVNKGDFAEGSDNKLYLGQTFSVSNVGWDKYGHIISKNTTYFTLPNDLYKHEHFNITQTANGMSTIRAYTEEEFNALTDKGMKFFSSATENTNNDYSATLPTLATVAMALNGVFAATKLYQTRGEASYRVVDESVRIYEGTTHGGTDSIYGAYDRKDNSIHFKDIITAGVYSAISINSKGLAVAGGQILEFGKTDNSDPTSALVIGGLFFRMHNTADTNGA